jgi:hypothetical protein
MLIGSAIAILFGGNAFAANDMDTPVVLKANQGYGNGGGLKGADTSNTIWLGHNDLQGRTTYQTTVHQYPNGKWYAFAGHFNGTMLNPMTGANEVNGTSIVDVTDPTNPVYVKHIPSGGAGIVSGGSRMNMICDGSVLPHGAAGHVYLLRENGSSAQEFLDVTDPANPVLASRPETHLNVTHRSWWDCNSGIAYIVGGAHTASNPFTDGWNPASSPAQHLKIYDASDPTNPIYIEDYGFPGSNPGGTFKIPGTNIVPTGVHGPIEVSTFRGQAKNRLYMPYGVDNNGIIQIVDVDKLLPPPWGHGTKFANPQRPTEAELLSSQIGVIYMPGAEGGHSSYPFYGIPVSMYQNFSQDTPRDILAVSSEEVDNRCQGTPHLLYLVDITAVKHGASGGSSAEQHPWPISTFTVNDFETRPNYCSRGTRFGVHSMSENFADPFYGIAMTSAWFDAGIRVTDIRDPYHPAELAHFVPPVNSFTQPSNWTVNGVPGSSLDVSCDNTYVDNEGLLYCGDRVGGGLDIVQLTGDAAKLLGIKGPPR